MGGGGSSGKKYIPGWGGLLVSRNYFVSIPNKQTPNPIQHVAIQKVTDMSLFGIVMVDCH